MNSAREPGVGKREASTQARERQVFLATATAATSAGESSPNVAVIELGLQDLIEMLAGVWRATNGSGRGELPVTTTDVAWTTLPKDHWGLPYEALVVVRDLAVQWERAVWMDEEALEGFGALSTRRSRCLARETEYVWETDHPDFGVMRTGGRRTHRCPARRPVPRRSDPCT